MGNCLTCQRPDEWVTSCMPAKEEEGTFMITHTLTCNHVPPVLWCEIDYGSLMKGRAKANSYQSICINNDTRECWVDGGGTIKNCPNYVYERDLNFFKTWYKPKYVISFTEGDGVYYANNKSDIHHIRALYDSEKIKKKEKHKLREEEIIFDIEANKFVTDDDLFNWAKKELKNHDS